MRWAWETFKDQAVLAASFQDCVLIDVAMQVAPEIEVVFLDTQYHFAETLEYVEQVRERYDLNLRVMEPLIEPDDLWKVDPDECCSMRKVEPLARALQGKAAWLTGLRRDEASTRANAPIVGYDIGRGIVKVNPIAGWSHDDIDALRRRPRPARAPAAPARATRRSGAGRARSRSPTARTRAPGAGPAAASSSAASTAGPRASSDHGRTDRGGASTTSRATGFDNEAEAYERARPSYPPDAVAWLSDALRARAGRDAPSTSRRAPASSPVCSRLSGADLLAVEPVDGMRAQLVQRCPDVPALAALAEALPFRDGVGSTRSPSRRPSTGSTPSARRPSSTACCAPAGGSGSSGTHRDRGVPWVDAVWSIMDGVEKKAPVARRSPTSANSATSLGSAVVHARCTTPTFRHEHAVTPDEMVDRVRSVSHVAALATGRA